MSVRANEADLAARLRQGGCVFAEEEARLLAAAARDDAHLDELVRARCRGVPLQHLVGWAEFCGHRVAVDPGVFIPRPRTQFLADVATDLVRPGAVVVDLCCGSGALALVIAARRPDADVHACDVDPVAVRCATRNLRGHSVPVHRGDLFDALPQALQGRVDVLVANVPYVPTDDLALLPPEARDHEPRRALDGGPDGASFFRRVAAGAGGWLAPGGTVAVETSARGAAGVARCFVERGFATRTHRCPDLEATVVTAT